MKNIGVFYLKNFSLYLNRRVFVMSTCFNSVVALRCSCIAGSVYGGFFFFFCCFFFILSSFGASGKLSFVTGFFTFHNFC